MRIDNASGYIEEKGSNKCLIFDSTDENTELLKRYDDVFNGIMSKIKNKNMIGLNIQRLHKN